MVQFLVSVVVQRHLPGGADSASRCERRCCSYFERSLTFLLWRRGGIQLSVLRHEQQSIRIRQGAHRVRRSRARERVTRRSTRPRSGRLPLPRRSSSCTTRKTPSGGCGQVRSRTLCRRAGCSGTPWSTGSTRARSFRSSMLLCRRWGIRCLRSWRRSQDLLGPEQLMEVPTEPGYALAVHASGSGLMEQNADIPVPPGCGGRGGPSCFPPWTGFNSVLWSRSRRKSVSSRWRSSRFSPETGFKCFTRALAKRRFALKKMRGWVRTRGWNWPRSRARPRGELMPCPWFLRTTSQRRSRSPRSRRTATSGWMGPGVSGEDGRIPWKVVLAWYRL